MHPSSDSVEINSKGAIIMGSEFAADGPCTGRAIFVSHAHSDHIGGLRGGRRGGDALCTPATYDLACYALGYKPKGVRTVEYNKSVVYGEESLTLFPANHILGSAQALVETRFGSIAYTGDFKQPGTPVLSADVLVIEATYGSPIYRREVGDAEVALVETVEKHLKEGPICVYGYTSKVQEALGILMGFVDAEFLLDSTCDKVAKIYLKHGYKLPKYNVLDNQEVDMKSVVFKPLSKAKERFRGTKILLTGWAPNLITSISGGYMIRLSDHADYTQLMSYVEEAKPKVVYTDGWRSSYAKVLAKEIENRLGVKAHPLPR
ncbi:MAG: MBL fold metallo-hydrolase [Thermoprotei archaeon]